MKWKGWVPLKCKIMVWRAMLNRMPTKVDLSKRGVTLPNDLCNLCDSEAETTNHLFIGCTFAADIWARVVSWCRLPPFFAFVVCDFLEIAKLQAASKKSRYILRGIVFTTLWAIWNERNARIFTGIRRRPIEVMESIKMTSYFWFRNRTRMKGLVWNVWCKYPLDVM
ncbi:putative reverse transcriptase zinc-binding domain-containing protein [Helianthus annuus]|nr:putative reverse transcriptase zinc-binding domain-containing protein [Helianthus annuus]